MEKKSEESLTSIPFCLFGYGQSAHLTMLLYFSFLSAKWSNKTGSCSSPYDKYSNLLSYFQVTYTFSEFLLSAEEGVGYTTDFPIDEKAFCLTVSEYFVQIKS